MVYWPERSPRGYITLVIVSGEIARPFLPRLGAPRHICETDFRSDKRSKWGRRGTVSVPMLRALVATVLAAFCLSGSSARSDDIPTLDVNPVCHGIAMQGELEAGLQQTSFQQCVQSEQVTRDEMKKEWSTFSTADKSHCVALAKTGGESSYTELITCMEMARDVRKLHSEAENSSAPVPVGLPAPVGHRQPTAR